MVCLRNICINTLHQGDSDDNDDDDDDNDDDYDYNNNNNNNNNCLVAIEPNIQRIPTIWKTFSFTV
jgi:hypothetical protein